MSHKTEFTKVIKTGSSDSDQYQVAPGNEFVLLQKRGLDVTATAAVGGSLSLHDGVTVEL